jgi:hypothetical protein
VAPPSDSRRPGGTAPAGSSWAPLPGRIQGGSRDMRHFLAFREIRAYSLDFIGLRGNCMGANRILPLSLAYPMI